MKKNICYSLNVLAPQIVLGDEIFINSTSVIITWKLLNVLMEDSVIVKIVTCMF